MNKKQWLVLGVGLIVMGIIFGVFSGRTLDVCTVIVNEALETYENAANSNMSVLEKQAFSPSDSTFTCYDQSVMLGAISTISWTLGVIFIILAFLEDKKK